METGKIIVGVLAGVAVGAVAGLLLAPDKGSETRKRLLSQSNDYLDVLYQKFDEFVENVTQNLETKQRESAEITKQGKAKYEEANNGAA
jgi:gas vesicle protein